VKTPEPVLVLMTGGTIDKQYFDALSRYEIAESVIPQLLAVAKVALPMEFEPLLRKDSLDLTDEDRALIVQRVRSSPHLRVVITHGTDTMTATARELSVIEGKTIVLTGALTPARFQESDAPFNLGMAFAACQIAPPGVYVAMNGTVFEWHEVVKDRAQQQFIRT
jgi:L-asparaginase